MPACRYLEENWGHRYPCFWTSGDISGFQIQSGQPYLHFAEVYMLHVPWDSPLVWHLLTSWGPAKSCNLAATLDFKWLLIVFVVGYQGQRGIFFEKPFEMEWIVSLSHIYLLEGYSFIIAVIIVKFRDFHVFYMENILVPHVSCSLLLLRNSVITKSYSWFNSFRRSPLTPIPNPLSCLLGLGARNSLYRRYWLLTTAQYSECT